MGGRCVCFCVLPVQLRAYSGAERGFAMKWIDIVGKKRAINMGICLLAAVGIFYAVNCPLTQAAATARQLPIYCVDRTDNMISISFDAAWGGGLYCGR